MRHPVLRERGTRATVQPYLVNGTAVLVNGTAVLVNGTAVLVNGTAAFFLNGTTVRKLRVNYGDSGTVVLQCENRHFILTTTVPAN